jgi:hypothetical protein
MAQDPTFSNPGKIARIFVASANTASDGSGLINTFLQEDNTTQFSGGTSGTRLEKIRFFNAQTTAATSSAMVIRVFISDNSGSNWRLFSEVTLAAATRSTSVVGAQGEIYFGGVDIGTGVKIGVAQSVYAGAQDLMHYTLEYSDY